MKPHSTRRPFYNGGLVVRGTRGLSHHQYFHALHCCPPPTRPDVITRNNFSEILQGMGFFLLLSEYMDYFFCIRLRPHLISSHLTKTKLSRPWLRTPAKLNSAPPFKFHLLSWKIACNTRELGVMPPGLKRLLLVYNSPLAVLS